MYLSAERVAVVNRTINDVFTQTCVAWQTIPHWDTGDAGQTEVSNDNLGVVPIKLTSRLITPTVAELIAPTPDALLTRISDATVKLAADVDDYVFPLLRNAAATLLHIPNANPSPEILYGLITARMVVETAGFRAPACLFGDPVAMLALYQLYGGYTSVKDSLLDAGNIGSFYRVNTLWMVGPPAPTADLQDPAHVVRAILLGRRQRIAPGYAAEASAGEEPVDLAVSIAPSFEIVGENPANTIKINVRIRYAVRPKTPAGLVVITGPVWP